MGLANPNLWPHQRISPQEPAELTPAAVATALQQLQQTGNVRLERLGSSARGRAINQATVGAGPTRVLAWSQMHGDEPTHTAMLLDVLAWLAGDDAAAVALRQACTFACVPMLNPDGAVLGTRQNAQGIDVNRDARRLQSPEGRVLHDLVTGFQPQFAFNLHNQNARSTVGRSRLPSVVALMAPPVDLAETETPGVRRAKQAAVCFAEAISQHCPGMISRYAASYMPRAFGEWVQTTGAATVLVEAGGMPADAPFDMVELHAAGFAAVLQAIANGRVESFDAARYDALPLDGEITRFDLLVRGALIQPGDDLPEFTADVGVNFAGGRRLATGPLVAGVIEELGDLEVTAGKATIDGAGLCCLPGRWAASAAGTPRQLPDDTTQAELLAAGVTTLLGVVDAEDEQALAALAKLHASGSAGRLLLNVGFLARTAGGDEAAVVSRLAAACWRGACAAVVDGLSESVVEQLHAAGIPCVAMSTLGREGQSPIVVSADSLPTEMLTCAGSMRGRVAKGAIADLIFYPADALQDPPAMVLVGGACAFRDGAPAGDRAGLLLAAQPATR